MIKPAEPAPASDRFITPPLSVALDLLRFVAALVVLVCHATQTGLYTGPFPNVPLAQHYAVVVFFVLSGLVIAASVQNRPTDFTRFMIARAARILPVSVAALAFGTAAYLLVTGFGGSAQQTDTYGELSWRGTVLPLLFLSESPWGAGPVWNPPFWSLCYEVWYYALFGAAVLLRGPARIAALCLFALLAGPRILVMLPIWLVGVMLVITPALRRIGRWSGLALASAGVVAAWYHTTALMPGLRLMKAMAGAYGDDLSFSRFALSDFLLALAVAAVIAGLRPVLAVIPRPMLALRSLAQLLAGFSFTLYLFHWPVLLLAKSAGMSAGDSPLAFAGAIAAILCLGYAISLGTEAQKDRVRAALTAGFSRLAARRAAPA